jgi:hypothetical protein
MSELNRLRELAALLQPKRVTEARVKTRADLEKKFELVQATVKDLADDLSEGGAVETMMDDVGVSDHKDAAAILKTLNAAVKTIQSALMEAEGLLFSAMTESRRPDPVNEMAKASEYHGGAFNRKMAKQMIASFKGKEDTVELKDGSEYEFEKMASGGNLKKGDIVFAMHDKYNTGAELYEILGFGKDDSVKYDDMKAVYAGTGVKTLKELEKFNDANEKDEVRLIVKDLDDGSSGDWFYVFEGRWAYGSGGEPLSFMAVKKIKDATVKEAKNHMDENTYQSVASWKRALKAKYGMGVRYVAHEGTIDAFAGEKDDIKKERQVGDWDDTTGTVY